MNKVFIDTSALVALFDEDDEKNSESRRILEKLKNKRLRIITTDYILDECITTVLSHAGHEVAVAVGEFMLSSNFIEIAWLDNTIKFGAWDFFKNHSDKGFSFTDCTSFVLMETLKLRDCFTFDNHFRQAGFREFS